jgi:hypothetical protein
MGNFGCALCNSSKKITRGGLAMHVAKISNFTFFAKVTAKKASKMNYRMLGNITLLFTEFSSNEIRE